MDDLRITTIQTNLYWEDIDQNLVHFEEKVNAINEQTDIIVLPEMFTTGFTMNPKVLAESHGDKGLQWMQRKSKEKNCVLVGSISVKDGEKFYNRLYWVMPDESYQSYDKRHLFQMGKEDVHYTAGSKKFVVEYKGWKICPLICYDLRFPVWSRNTKENTYDVLVYVANWPEVRSYPWKQLLIARAIENQAYVVGVNRIGQDGNAITHSGDSCILNPRGEIISKTKAHEDVSETLNLSFSYLEEFRKVFPVMLDGDEFSVL
ncbi:MAG: amidohydrolase [Bacteroidetes bacterium]|nr:amidohydrolase [Bacteroidota bacterium]